MELNSNWLFDSIRKFHTFAHHYY